MKNECLFDCKKSKNKNIFNDFAKEGIIQKNGDRSSEGACGPERCYAV